MSKKVFPPYDHYVRKWSDEKGAYVYIPCPRPLTSDLARIVAELETARDLRAKASNRRGDDLALAHIRYIEVVLQHVDSLISAAKRIEELEALVHELADDLEAEVEGHYEGTKDHPAMTPKYERDMEPVVRARKAATKETP